MNIGYIRVSDKSQNPDRQIEKMKVIGIEERFIFVDRQSGKDFSRPAYHSMKRVLRAGDLLYRGKLMEDQFLSLLSYVAAQERKKTRTRQREGIDLARRKGVRFGRPRVETTKDFRETIERWRSGEVTAREAMRICRMSPSTFYRRVEEWKEELR